MPLHHGRVPLCPGEDRGAVQLIDTGRAAMMSLSIRRLWPKPQSWQAAGIDLLDGGKRQRCPQRR
jgi:hypothetical protein